MGRIKTQLVKRTTLQLFKEHSDKFNTDYKGNKEQVANLIKFNSKKLKNIIAGYITRLKKNE